MNEELLRELRNLQQTSARLQQVVAGMQAPAMPPVEREDRSGAIFVRLGEDGVPDRIQVTEDWPRRIHPADIGQAVVEAYGTAMGARMKAWAAELEHTSWREALDSAASTVPTAPEGTDETARTQLPSTVPSMDKLAEEAVNLLGEAADAGHQEEPLPEVSSSQRVVISLSGGRLSSCAVDVRWARRQSARSLATALNSSLSKARSALKQEASDQEAAQDAQRKRAQALFDGALAIIKNPEGFADERRT